jgi:outer membrane protein assembly factor BamA
VRNLARLLALGALVCAAPAFAGLSVVPLPEILTDPNEGNTYGFLPVLLLLDRNGRLENIIADDIRYNAITGWYPSFRLYGYPTVDQRYFITLRKSQKIDEDFSGGYQREGMLDGAVDVAAKLGYSQDSRLRFFGFGNDTKDSGESNYTGDEFATLIRVAYHPIGNFQVAWQGRVETVSIHHGGVSDEPFTGTLYPNTPGLNGSTVNGQGFAVAYDDRDSTTITNRGTLGAARVEVVDRALGSSASYVKYDFELRRFVPLRDRVVLALHSVLDYIENGGQAPFYEQSSLGGAKSLRGFGDDRFVDSNRFFSTVELRTMALRRQMFDVLTEFEVAPFVDVGQVFASSHTVPVDDLHLVGGVGFRGVVRPQVVGFVDVGYGSDGAAVFTGLDYPF